jgi:uncharacterized protein (DUF433 family)
MSIQEVTVPIHLREDENGVLRVGETRVRLDTVITAWKQGDSPEQIAENFDVLTLADIYAVISYYLHARPEVESYLARNQRRAEQLRSTNTDSVAQDDLRARLLARRQATLDKRV